MPASARACHLCASPHLPRPPRPKADGNYLEANWHFIDVPIVDEANPPPAPPPQPPLENVAWAISEGSSTVRSAKSTALDKSRQLRFMVHFVGDVHQPLHAASYFSEQFPAGDAGGNAWPIAGGFATELHAFMDAGAGLWQTTYPRPLSPTDAADIKAQAAALMAALPPTDPSIAGLIALWPPMVWANESASLAESVVYKAPQAPTPLPADYIAATQALCRRQVVLAGYRLAHQIAYVLGSEDKASRLARWTEDARLAASRRAERLAAPATVQRPHARLRKGAAAL